MTDLNRQMWEPARMREWLKGAQANPRLGHAGRYRAAGRLPGRPWRGLHHRTDHRGGWRLHHYRRLAIRTGRLSHAPPASAACSWRRCSARSKPSSSPVPWIATCAPTTPGKCPRCGMTLVANLPEPVEYPVDLRVDPPQIPSARPDHARISHRRSAGLARAVNHFEIVHEKLFHLFIVSQDLAVLRACASAVRRRFGLPAGYDRCPSPARTACWRISIPPAARRSSRRRPSPRPVTPRRSKPAFRASRRISRPSTPRTSLPN